MSVAIKEARKRLRPSRLDTPDLTECQRNVLAYMLRCWLSGYVPAIREIGDQFGIRSPNGVMCHIRALCRKGYLTNEYRCGYALTDAALELVL